MNNNELMLDVGQANELKLAFRRNDWTNEEIKALSEGNFLGEVLKVIRGQARIETIVHLIDCDAPPLIPEGLKLRSHQQGGQFQFDATKIFLQCLVDKPGETILGKDFERELKCLNANVLDYLYYHPELIPHEWRGKCIIFWGTTYFNDKALPAVRSLVWNNSNWEWVHLGLRGVFTSSYYVALMKV